jgi:hypothetical protein
MFGSNFFGNFGIPDPSFGYKGADAQGGYLGPNDAPDQASQNAAPAGIPGTPGVSAGIPAPPQQPTPAAPSPLAGGPLAPGGIPPGAASPGAIHTSDNTIEQTAPAAGIGSPFGKAPNG